ncbi:MAG: hypothetical protein JJ879_14830 [Sneathiella sp.]|nr:hypothetical protein [Sneathiella sp.]
MSQTLTSSSPQSVTNVLTTDILGLLERHKAEVASRAAAATGFVAAETELLVIIEGLTQAWPLRGDAAVEAAKQLARALRVSFG